MIYHGKTMTPRTAALCQRIWGYCQPGWGYTYADVAEALGETQERVQRAAVLVGWQGRFTAVSDGGRDFVDRLSGGRTGVDIPTRADLEPFRRLAAMAWDNE